MATKQTAAKAKARTRTRTRSRTEDPATERKRRSIDELSDSIERSGERLANDLSSSLLAWTEAGTDVFLSGVRAVAHTLEAGVRNLDSRRCAPGEEGARTTGQRILDTHRDALIEATRIQADAIGRAAEIAQSSVERALADSEDPVTDSAPAG